MIYPTTRSVSIPQMDYAAGVSCGTQQRTLDRSGGGLATRVYASDPLPSLDASPARAPLAGGSSEAVGRTPITVVAKFGTSAKMLYILTVYAE